MNYYNYKYFLDSVVKLLNGKVNKTLRCHKHIYTYSPDEVHARESYGCITFNLQSIAYNLKDMELTKQMAHMIGTASHELSHIDQDINYYKYERDCVYRSWIERSNELNSICFIMDNINMIKLNLGDFDHSIFEQFYYYAKSRDIKYVTASKSRMISNILETYMIETNKTRYKDLSTILLNINGYRYIIKQNGEVIDPNIIYPVIYDLSYFKTMKVFNVLKDSNTLIIRVEAKDEDRKLEDVIHRIDEQYIVHGAYKNDI